MSANRVDPAIQNQVLGHANVGMDAHYHDGVTLEELQRQLSGVDFRGLDLSPLSRHQLVEADGSAIPRLQEP